MPELHANIIIIQLQLNSKKKITNTTNCDKSPSVFLCFSAVCSLETCRAVHQPLMMVDCSKSNDIINQHCHWSLHWCTLLQGNVETPEFINVKYGCRLKQVAFFGHVLNRLNIVSSHITRSGSQKSHLHQAEVVQYLHSTHLPVWF